MVGTTIQRLVNLIEKSLIDLNASSSQDFIESTAILIHESMSGPNRRFHTTDHVFQVIDPQGNPTLILAALFHDIVYYNVDEGMTERIHELLKPYISIELEQVFIRRRGPSQDNILPIVTQVFGFSYGQMLTPYTGQNEFLSALVFAKLFHNILPIKELLGVLTCLEGSIPFRHDDENGKSCFELIEQRLLKLNRTRGFELDESEIIEMVKNSLRFANIDVGNFGCSDAAVFLDNTWKLLPENNPHLLTNKVYTLKNYRVALEKMETFFHKVDVSAIFHQYRNVPSQTEFASMQAQATNNVRLGKDYLCGRLLVTGILEALCMVTGGDAPVVMLMGNNTRGNVEPKYEFNDLINRLPVEMAKDVDAELLSLFDYEADQVFILDFRKTPLAAFVYKRIGHAKLQQYLSIGKEYFSGAITAQDFLNRIDGRLVGDIAGVCAEMISTRRHRFLSFTRTAPKSKKKQTA